MLELAVVTKINKKYAKVRIGRNSACAACGKCGMTQNQKYIDITVENSCVSFQPTVNWIPISTRLRHREIITSA